MRLYELLKETESSKKQRIDNRLLAFMSPTDMLRLNEGIIIGEYCISIQSSSGHYCEPRITLEDIKEYTSMEMGIWKSDGGDFLDCSEFKDFNRLEDLKDCYSSPVFGYVEVDLINDFISYLESK